MLTTFKTRDTTCLEMKETWFLLVCWVAKNSKLISCHFHKKVFQKKTLISEKRNFFGQILFLSHVKPGLYTSRLYFFFFENHELRLKGK